MLLCIMQSSLFIRNVRSVEELAKYENIFCLNEHFTKLTRKLVSSLQGINIFLKFLCIGTGFPKAHTSKKI